MGFEKKMKYPIKIHKDPKSDFGVIVPDLPGCFSAGKTFEEAMDNAKEAVECRVEGLLKDGDAIPKPSSMEVLQKRSSKNCLWAIVEIDISKLSVKAKRVNITISEGLLRTIDKYAKTSGESRSGFLTRAAMEFISSR